MVNLTAKTNKMKLFLYVISVTLLVSSQLNSQTFDSLINTGNKKTTIEVKEAWSKEKNEIYIETIRKKIKYQVNNILVNIGSIYSDIPLSAGMCINNSFESQYNSWTGLEMSRVSSVSGILPIEDGVYVDGITSLPHINQYIGGSLIKIENTGNDNIIPWLSKTTNLTPPSNSSMVLGNTSPGLGAEGIAKKFVVSPSKEKFYFQYAMVMEPSHSNPDGSMDGTEVFFMAAAIDQNGNIIDKVTEIGNPNNPYITLEENTPEGEKYVRNWRCANLDLSGYINKEVVVLFVNADCSKGAHEGYTYVDETCVECKNLNEGTISIDVLPDSCLDFPQQISGTYALPNQGNVSNEQIKLYLYQSNSIVGVHNNPSTSGTNYVFTLDYLDFNAPEFGECFDIVAKLSFDIIDINGNVHNIEKYSTDVSGSTIEGESTGINNDVCMCPLKDCCQVELDIRYDTPDEIPASQTEINGTEISTATEYFEINQSSTLPITELRVAITDIIYSYKYEDCAQCVDNPALWGSLIPGSQTIGNGSSLLNYQKPSYSPGFPDMIDNNETIRELIWENQDGAMLQAGDQFSIGYILPPAVDIPCCVPSVKICTEISWKDANCNLCTIPNCRTIEISSSDEVE